MKIEDINYTMSDDVVDEENFDIEKWRKEKPMDYLLAVFLINSTSSSIVKNEVFKTIYKVIY